MEIKDILLVIIPFITAIISSWLTYFFTIKSRKDESILRFKEEKYANLILHLQGFIGKTTSGDIKRKFFEEQYKSWLYASDDVVIAINSLIDLIISEDGKTPNQKKGREVVGNIILKMRQDLLGRTRLKNINFRYTDVIE